MAKQPQNARRWVRVQALTHADIAFLREQLSKNGPAWQEFEYKLHRDRIIISKPVIPFGADGKPDPAQRYMIKHLRITPIEGSILALEFFRHTNQWHTLHIHGTLQQLVQAIGPHPFCQPDL